jgi:hypothetical protein
MLFAESDSAPLANTARSGEYQPAHPALHHIMDKATDIEAFHEVNSVKRSHSWPVVRTKHKVVTPPNTIYNTRTSWNSSILKIATSSRYFQGRPFYQESYASEKSTELPVSLAIFPKAETQTGAATPHSKELASSPPPSRTQSPCCLRTGQDSPLLGSGSHISGWTSHPRSPLRHRTALSDLERECTLKEASELPSHEPRDICSLFALEPSIGRITLPTKRSFEGRLVSDTKAFEHRPA